MVELFLGLRPDREACLVNHDCWHCDRYLYSLEGVQHPGSRDMAPAPHHHLELVLNGSFRCSLETISS